MKKDYRKEAKNARALVQVSAWLKAVNVAVVPSEEPGCDLTVQSRGGGSVQVVVAMTAGEARGAQEAIVVLAKELTSKHSSVALKAFHTITEAAGFGSPLPIDRGPEPKKKLHFDDNFELVSMRHKEFRRVPNPTDADLKYFSKVIAKAVGRFMYINQVICRRHLVQFEDLQTYAQVWTCNYLGLYSVANPTVNDNERKLYAYLCQRFAEFASMLVKKERNCLPDPETTAITFTGKTYGEVRQRSLKRVSDEPADFEPLENAEDVMELGSTEIDTDLGTEETVETVDQEEKAAKSADLKRRKLAQSTLSTELGKLEHSVLIETLDGAHKNPNLCYDARKEAQKQLRLHKAGCSVCIAAAAKVNEDLAGKNPGSAVK